MDAFESTIRDGNFLYEEYLAPDNNLDIKVYVVNDQVFAESRVSPATTSTVDRLPNGKERRTPVELSPEEVELARDVAAALEQNICGLDILRHNGKPYLLDVNGFSFVKDDYKWL